MRLSKLARLLVLVAVFMVDVTAVSAGDERDQYLKTEYWGLSEQRFTKRPQIGRDLYVVLVLDTAHQDARQLGLVEDGIAIKQFLAALFPGGKCGSHKLTVAEVVADDVTKENLLKSIKNLPSEQSDTILFYYSGHGGWDKFLFRKSVESSSPDGKGYDHDSGHYIATHGGDIIYRSEIKAALASRPAQLRMLVTDCCANFPSVEEGSKAKGRSKSVRPEATLEGISTVARTKPLATNVRPRVVEQLFFECIGWVSINACPPGDVTAGSREGGLFTKALYSKLVEEANGAIEDFRDWRFLADVEVMKRTKKAPKLEFALPKGALVVVDDLRDEDNLLYSYVLSHTAHIGSIAELPEKVGPIHGLPVGTTLTVNQSLELSDKKGFLFQKGRILLSDEDVERAFPYVSLSFLPVGLKDEKIELKQGHSFAVNIRSAPSLVSDRYLESTGWLKAVGDTPPRRLPGGVRTYSAFVTCGIRTTKADPERVPMIEDFRQAAGKILTLTLPKAK